MASVTRRRGCKIWSAFFRDEHGRQHCYSTGTDIRKHAEIIAHEYEEAARKRKTMRQIQKTLETLREKVSGETIPRETLRQFAEGWLATKHSETAPRTFDFYSDSVKKLLSHLEGNLPLADITRNRLLAYRSALCARGLAPTTVNHHLTVAKMIFRAARRDGLIVDDPSEFVSGVKKPLGKAGKRPFKLAELKAVLEVADPEWRSMILFGLYSGQRLGDIARLTWSNLDLPGAVLRLTTSKTHKILIIPMADPLIRHAEGLSTSDDPFTPIHPRAFSFLQKQGKTGGLSSQFARLLAEAGLRPYEPHTSKGKGLSARRDLNSLSFHSLRHTATTMMHEAGQPAPVVQALIGHDSEAMHRHYVSVGFDSAKEAVNALPDLVGG